MVMKNSLAVVCPDCKRGHSEDMPCPLRVARYVTGAYSKQMDQMSKLSIADRKWIVDNPAFSVIDLVEGSLATLM